MDESGIEGAREKLYSRGTSEKEAVQQSSVPSPVSPVPETWEAPAQKIPMHKSLSRYFFLGSIGFFVVAILASIAVFLLGGRIVSPDLIVLKVDGPSVIGGGEKLSFTVRVQNKNPVGLSYGELTVTFPEGSRSGDDPSKDLIRSSVSLETMNSGEQKDFTFSGILFADEGTQITIPISLEYRTVDSNAVVVKEMNYTLVVSDAPLTVSVKGDTTAVSGNTIALEVLVQAHQDVPDVGVQFSFPFGFTVTDANPSLKGRALLPLGSMKAGEEKTITLKGIIVGGDGENRVIRIGGGVIKDDSLHLRYGEVTQTIILSPPLLSLNLTLEGREAKEYSTAPGSELNGVLSWRNDLESRVFDATITLAFAGTGFNALREGTSKGFWDAESRVLTLTSDLNPELAILEPGEKGTIPFSFVTQSGTSLVGVSRPTVSISGEINGKSTNGDAVEKVASSVNAKVLFLTALGLSSGSSYSSGSFANTGPMPPKVGQQTTYTITLAVSAGTNTVADAVVSGTLPSYVTFTGAKNPTSADVTVSELSRELRWSAGEISAGTSKTVSFQVALTPNSSQKNTAPTLVGALTASGFDRFTQQAVSQSIPSMTTLLTNDPNATPEWALVSN